MTICLSCLHFDKDSLLCREPTFAKMNRPETSTGDSGFTHCPAFDDRKRTSQETFDPINDTWRCIWEAMAMTDPRSTVAPDVAVDRHREWCDAMAVEYDPELGWLPVEPFPASRKREIKRDDREDT